MAELAFSSEHRTQFKELLARGEVHAINLHPEQLEFGPWSLGCDAGDSDEAERLKSRFRAAARKAALAAGAPARSNLLDWWVTRLARGQKRLYIQTLIQRSIEYCDKLETNALDGRPLIDEFGGAPGLSRDRYYSESVPYWLYIEPHSVLPDAKQEFGYWEKYISQSFNAAIDRIANRPRFIRRWVDVNGEKRCKPKEHVRRILTAEMENRTGYLDSCVEGLSYDLAVLRANYVIDRGYRGDAAARAFASESSELLEGVRLTSRQAWKRLGLSWKKLVRRDQDLAKPFREVQRDLQVLSSEIPIIGIVVSDMSGNEADRVSTPADGSQDVPDPDQAQTVLEQTEVGAENIGEVSAEESERPIAPGTVRRRGRRAIPGRREAISDAIAKHGEGLRDHLSDIFDELDKQTVPLGDFQRIKIDLGGGETLFVEKWADLDLSVDDQRRQIVDTLRKYVDARGFNSEEKN